MFSNSLFLSLNERTNAKSNAVTRSLKQSRRRRRRRRRRDHGLTMLDMCTYLIK